MNFWVALALYIMFIGGYWFFVWSIWWHVREYTLPHDQSQYIVRSFFVIAILLTILSFLLFFTVPYAL